MPIIAAIGDVHGAVDHLASALAAARERGAGGVLLTGDLAPMRSPRTSAAEAERRARRVLNVMARSGLPFAFVPGNHDREELEHPANADRRVVAVAGLAVAGIGGAGPTRFGFPYEWSEDDIRARPHLDADILLSHAPPFGTALDRLRGTGQHAGSRAIRERAEAWGGVLVCGHIHESPGFDRIGATICVNAGALAGPAAREQLVLLHFDASRRLRRAEHLVCLESAWRVTAELDPGAPG